MNLITTSCKCQVLSTTSSRPWNVMEDRVLWVLRFRFYLLQIFHNYATEIFYIEFWPWKLPMISKETSYILWVLRFKFYLLQIFTQLFCNQALPYNYLTCEYFKRRTSVFCLSLFVVLLMLLAKQYEDLSCGLSFLPLPLSTIH